MACPMQPVQVNRGFKPDVEMNYEERVTFHPFYRIELEGFTPENKSPCAVLRINLDYRGIFYNLG